MNSISFQDYDVRFVVDTDEITQWLKSRTYSQFFVLVDENTKRDCLPLVDFKTSIVLIEIQSGEQSKTLETCQFIWNQLLKNNADRNSVLVNLGGGVISDMGGFCASIFKRGIDFVNIPTTLLAQVDATIGGKTGVDFHGQKNMLGLFSFPKAVWVYPSFLATLSTRQIKSGKAEMLKHGLIADEAYWNELQDSEISQELIAQSVEFKKKIVLADTYESGERKKLNFGHTIGHAIESYSLKNHENPLLHGEAIVLGMIAELYLSNQLLNFPKEKMEEVQGQLYAHLDRVFVSENFLPLDEDAIDEVLVFLENDKKNNQGRIQAALLKGMGDCAVDIVVKKDEWVAALKQIK